MVNYMVRYMCRYVMIQGRRTTTQLLSSYHHKNLPEGW